jgi:ribosome-binding protein aMBF1 (putative translation factor)
VRPEKRKALEAAGWTFGDAADFLAMSDEERQMLDLRVNAALAVRRQREAMELSQQELAHRIHTSQPRIVKIERAASDVTLDQILRAYAAAGGRVALREVAGERSKRRPGRGKKTGKRKKATAAGGRSAVQIELGGRER